MSELLVQNLRKAYKTRVAVHDISLTVRSGEIVGLLGPNGAGKTTSFYMIAGLIACDAGRIILDNTDLTRLPVHQRARLGITYLPQEPSIFRKMTVSQNIFAILELLPDITHTVRLERLAQLLSDLGIEHLRNDLAIGLSGGERRRVEIARCLAINPRFILLDEPFAGIDPIAVLDIQRIIHALNVRGIGILITDHNVRETLATCDRAYIINQGLVLASGLPDELVANENVRSVYLGAHFQM